MATDTVTSLIERQRSSFRGSLESDDAALIERCQAGDQNAWFQLLDKYRRLILSIPLRYGASRDEAADIFQAVSIDLFSSLGQLREPGALPAWLVQVASHRCFHWRQERSRRAEEDLGEMGETLPSEDPLAAEAIEAEEQIESVRKAIAKLPQRYQELVYMLFYEQPPRSYQEVAAHLGLSTGSIGFLRGRCLRRLQRILEEMSVEPW